MDSILESCKKMLGNGEGYDYFDPEIIMFINSVFSTLNQLGVGPDGGFAITGSDEKWSDYSDNKIVLGFVKPYIFKKVKVTFDPPQTSFVLQALQDQIAEDEWRLNIECDTSGNPYVPPLPPGPTPPHPHPVPPPYPPYPPVPPTPPTPPGPTPPTPPGPTPPPGPGPTPPNFGKIDKIWVSYSKPDKEAYN